MQPKSITINVNAKDFSKAIASVVYAASKDAWKASLTCVYIWAGWNGLMQLAALDGHRIAASSIRLIDRSTDPFEVLIPGKELRRINALLKKLKKDDADVLQLSVGAGTATFAVEGKILESVATSDQQYPEYRQLFPAKSSHSLVCNRMALVGCLKKSDTAEDGALIQLSVNSPEQAMNISVGCDRQYHAAGSINIKTKNDTTLLVLSRGYLLEALTAIASTEVEIRATPGEERYPITIATFKAKTVEAIALIVSAKTKIRL